MNADYIITEKWGNLLHLFCLLHFITDTVALQLAVKVSCILKLKWFEKQYHSFTHQYGNYPN